MVEREENRNERVYDVFWFQHNPDDWVAEVTDQQTGTRTRVYTLDELFVLLTQTGENGATRTNELEPRP